MELTAWDVEQLNRLTHGDKLAGAFVQTKTGKVGRTYSSEELIGNKVRVYCLGGEKLLCDPETLIIKGFIN